MGTIGLVLSLVALIVMALRGVNILIASLICAAMVAITNNQSLVEALSTDYIKSMMGFAGAFFTLFLTGAVFGQIMAESGAANSMAIALRRVFGDQRSLLIIVVATTILTYGGVNVFIVVFALYPLAVGLVHRANIPKRLLVGAVALGAGTYTMTALPGSPSIHNNISAQALGTTLTAGPILGLIAGAVMFALGMAYLTWQERSARARGEVFTPGNHDAAIESNPSEDELPNWLNAALPLTAVILFIVVPRLLLSFNTDALAQVPEEHSVFIQLLALSKSNPVFWTSLALVVGILLAVILNRRYLDNPLKTISSGAEKCALPLLNTAAVIGFGGVVSTTPIFETFANTFTDSALPPLVAATLSINVIAGITGSASGGLQIWMSTFAQQFLDTGLNPGTLHRVVTIASGMFDSLPHSGAIITMLTICGLTHREAYKDIMVVTILIPSIATAVILIIAILTGG